MAAGNGAAAPRLEADIRGIADLLAARAVEAGRYAEAHGRYVNQLSTAFANQLLADCRAYAGKLLEAERSKTAELEQLLGHRPPADAAARAGGSHGQQQPDRRDGARASA